MKWISAAAIACLGLSLISPLVGEQQPRFLDVGRRVTNQKVADAVAPSTAPKAQQPAPASSQNNPAELYSTETKNLIEKAQANPNLSTFVSAIKAADLTDTLATGGPYTIFAPSNDAFKQLPKGVLDRLLKPENKKELIAILTYHVVPGKVLAKDAKTMKARTLNGQDLNVEAMGGMVTVDDAEVIQPDIKAKNGVIHVIDEVVSPPAK